MTAPSSREHKAGELLDGRYLLLQRLGRGGFGDVWRAEELLPDGAPLRSVALKLLQKTAYDATSWAEEAKLLASFRHPSLVTIYAAGLLGGAESLPFVAMELLEGKTLADVLRERRRIPWRRVLQWMRAVAAALDVIHERGVIHLDLKPANLFLSNDGAIKVLDFGISRRAGSKPAEGPPVLLGRAGGAGGVADAADAGLETGAFVAATSSEGLSTAAFVAAQDHQSASTARASSSGRVAVGTPGYMAPEVLELADPTPAADAYALAAMIVKLATGRMPYEDVAEEPSELSDPSAVTEWWSDLRDATLRGRLRDIASDPAGLPRGLVALLMRLLSVDPLQRGVTTGKLCDLVEEVWQRPFGILDPPYPGLSPLPKEAEGLLFGRDDDVSRLGRELGFEPLVVLVGPRGAGKSSLARAGLVPHLARSFVDDKDDWVEVVVRPGQTPDDALDDALGALDLSLVGASFEVLSRFAAASPVGFVLIVDPLEETLLAPAAESERLLSLLGVLAEREAPSGLRVIGVVGERYAQQLSERVSSLRRTLRFVGPPAAAAVQEIVTGPLRLAGARLVAADAIVAEVQRELREADDRLPLIALALRSFWDKRTQEAGERAPSVLSVERWRLVGGVEGALAEHASRVIAALADGPQALAIEAMLRLSTTDRKLVSWDEAELVAILGDDPKKASLLLLHLESLSLLRRRAGRVELSHPTLPTVPRIEQARMRETERLVFLERLHEAAIAWDRAAGHPDFLLTGSLFDEVLRRPEWTQKAIGPLERQLVEASKKLARRRKIARAGLGLFLIALIVAGVVTKRAVDRLRALDERARFEAEERAYVADAVARSRRVDDPYYRAAWIGEAIERGSTDPALALDLVRASSGLPNAFFLSMAPSASPIFPWDDRFLIATGGGTSLILVDFHFDPFYQPPTEDNPKEKTPPELHPHTLVIRPHEAPFVERVPFAFDTAFATRATNGEVRVFRLREDGSVALAAIAPMRCASSLEIAAEAPVLACAGEKGLLRWDMRRADVVDSLAFAGLVLDVSPDGSSVVAAFGNKAVVWRPEAETKTVSLDASRPIVLASFGSRDKLLALAEVGMFEIFAPEGSAPDKPIFHGESVGTPTALRWDEGGLDLGICGFDLGNEELAVGAHHYLRHGARAKADGLPKGKPCERRADERHPRLIRSLDDVRELSRIHLGARELVGGYKLEGGRVLTQDLVLLSGTTPAVDPLLRFRAEDASAAPEPEHQARSVSAVVRENKDVVAFQVEDEVRFYHVRDGKRELSRKGNLLRRCRDGRVAAWEHDDLSWRVIDARSGAVMGSVPREPGFVLAVNETCSALFTQRLDGALVASPLGSDGGAPRTIAMADGYVYDVRISRARGDVSAALWVALSSGAIARIDEATFAVRVMAYASPRASAFGDGPRPGELVFADDTGVLLVGPSRALRLLDAMGGTSWEDISVAPEGTSMLLVSRDRVAALDISRCEIVGSLPMAGRNRFLPWDADGSVLVWSSERVGGAEADIIPRGRPLAERVTRALSNLRIDRGRIGILN